MYYADEGSFKWELKKLSIAKLLRRAFKKVLLFKTITIGFQFEN